MVVLGWRVVIVIVAFAFISNWIIEQEVWDWDEERREWTGREKLNLLLSKRIGLDWIEI